MKVYIPFNSNDFNSIFTTLSISPNSFYPNRRFSFKRASPTLLNKNEDFLIGYDRPIFHTKDTDLDYGLPVLLAIEIDKLETDLLMDKSGVRYLPIEFTVYLVNDFKLLFRSQKELDETLFKSLKSIETKYTLIAQKNSIVVKDDCFVTEPPIIRLTPTNPNFNSLTFLRERKLNKLLGIILGSSIAYSNSTPREWQQVLILLRHLNNFLSLYLNKLGDDGEFEKNQTLEAIDKISKAYESIEKIDEAIMLGSTVTSSLLSTLKQSNIFNISAFDLIIEGLLALSDKDLPLSLLLVKLKRAINSKYNLRYPNNYIEKINTIFSDVRAKIESQVTLIKQANTLNMDSIIKPHFIKNKLELSISGNLTKIESKYLVETLYFFVNDDEISDVETFFTNRKDILINLAKHFKGTIENFDDSNERKYLIDLLSSFDSLRGGFHISSIKNEVMKSLAILFTSGRDLLRFIENNEREEIQNSLIYYTIWSGLYGAAILPKTLTETITNNESNVKCLINTFNETIRGFEKTQSKGISTEIIEQVTDKNSSQPERKVNEPIKAFEKPISILASQLLEQVELKKKIKLSDLMKLSNSFKKQSDIQILIKSELNNKVRVTKSGRLMFAEKIENNKELFN